MDSEISVLLINQAIESYGNFLLFKAESWKILKPVVCVNLS